MKRLPFLFVFSVIGILAFTSQAVKGTTTESKLKAEVLKVDAQREKALRDGDVAALSRIDADDMVYTNWRGVTMTKAQHLSLIKAKKLTFHTFKHRDVQVRIFGQTAVLTGTSRTHVVYKGVSPEGARKFVNVYVKEGSRWICVVHFEAPVAR